MGNCVGINHTELFNVFLSPAKVIDKIMSHGLDSGLCGC